jgi:ABC-type multidrug transport system permease subunit
MTTVREAVQFSTRLRLSESVSLTIKNAFAEEIMSTLELRPIADQIVGTLNGGGLSVEQRKRLTIAVELGANPSVLFLDEPTSGLDARAAIIVLQSVREIAYTGRSVMCTIHQPSTFLFQMFDQLLLLKRGGETVFFGELGHKCCHLISYFQQYPDTHRIEDGANPATWMLEVIGAGTGTLAHVDYAAFYRASSLQSINVDELQRLVVASKSAPLSFKSAFAASYATQFRELHIKYRNIYYRTPSYNFTRIVVGVFIGGVFGSVYYRDSVEGVSDLQSRISMIFMTTCFNGVINMSSVLPIMALERDAFYRERAAKTYGVATYALATCVVEIPYILVTSLMFLFVFYFSCSLEFEIVAFLKYATTYIVFISIYTSFGQFLSAALPSTQAAQVVGGAFAGVWNLFGGLFITYSNIPVYWSFAYWITPMHYALEAMTASQFAKDNTVAFLVANGTIPITVEQMFAGAAPDFSYSFFGYDILVLVIFFLFFRISTYLALKHINHLAR